MIGGPGPLITIRGGFGPESELTSQKVKPGTARRILPYAKPYRWSVVLLLFITVLDALIIVTTPLLFKVLIDDGIMPRNTAVVVWIAVTVAGLSLLQAFAGFVESWFSARISEGLIYELRTTVFTHVQRQPLAFFTRAQTGALVSRLNTDVVAAQQAMTSLLSMVVSSALILILVLGTIFYLSWVVGLVAVVVLPFFLLPGKVVGRRLQRLLRESMQLDAELGNLMNERFNVAGALLAKLYGRPDDESALFSARSGRVRDIGVVTAVYSRMLLITVTLLASLATAVVYGLGGGLVIDGAFQIGTLVALAALLTRLFGPINQLSNVQSQVMTALVSFDRLFEVLDLKPLIVERPGAVALPPAGEQSAPEIEFDAVSFAYPSAAEVSLASLESVALRSPERTSNAPTLNEVSFRAPAGKLTALVGPSGAGKTTITQLVPRLYDPGSGVVRIGGHDLRDLTLASLRDTIGMVTQDAHLYHDTLRGNLLYARPGASEEELIEACRAAQIWDLISSLPNGLDTIVGDRGYRFSGGEKQRIAIARLLLKSPSVVVLDEATAHLDSESEAAVQRALRTALAGRTSLVIAHRLSTIREADQILVIDQGRIVERGTHDALLQAGGLYAELYRTQFARQPQADDQAAELVTANAAHANGSHPDGPHLMHPDGSYSEGMPPEGGAPPEGGLHLLPPPSGAPPAGGRGLHPPVRRLIGGPPPGQEPLD
jgi:ATP-binding cassette subfamily B protein